MRVLLDTNIIIRAAQPNQPTWPEINQALTSLVAHGCKLCVVPQNIYEFWVVATRPQAQNGFGLTASDAGALVEGTLGKLTLLRDERGIFDLWTLLVNQYAVEGKSAHDTRLVAAMQRHSIAATRISASMIKPMRLRIYLHPTCKKVHCTGAAFWAAQRVLTWHKLTLLKVTLKKEKTP